MARDNPSRAASFVAEIERRLWRLKSASAAFRNATICTKGCGIRFMSAI
ncbi:hypothetical protein [Sulfitobacter sp. HI0054]